ETIWVWGGGFIVGVLPPNAGRSKLLIRRTRGRSRLISGSFIIVLEIIAGWAELGLCDACLGMHTHESINHSLLVIIRGNQDSLWSTLTVQEPHMREDRRRDGTRIAACHRSRRRT